MTTIISGIIIVNKTNKLHINSTTTTKKQKTKKNPIKKWAEGTSLVVQWLRILLPIQGTLVQALLWEDPTCHGATNPMHHNYWACALDPMSHNYWARATTTNPVCLEPVLHNKRSHRNEKPMHHNEEQPPLAATKKSPCAATKTQCSQK